MYKVPVEVRPSDIEGQGVFSLSAIVTGAIVWIFVPGHDVLISLEEYEAWSHSEKEEREKTGYLSPWSGKWVFPPKGDPACYTNHSSTNNLSVVYSQTVSTEPYFVANRDIKPGEELTNNYHEFDRITQNINPDWAK